MLGIIDRMRRQHGHAERPARDVARHHTVLQVWRYDGDDPIWHRKPYDISEHHGNVLLTAGITAMWNLVVGNGSSTAFSAANAYVGVGDSSTAASAAQTDLQAATNKLRKAVVFGSPAVSGATATWLALFGTAEGNYAWNEFIVANASAAGVALNRVVSAQGTKSSSNQWLAVVSITLT